MVYCIECCQVNPFGRYSSLPHERSRQAKARAPPDWLEAGFDQTCLIESEQAEYEFDQTVRW
jgi:hypothetical protein